MKKLLIVSLLVFSSSFLTLCEGQYMVLYSFDQSHPPYGSEPQGSLTLSGKKLYGMTSYGGEYGPGCIFSIDTTGNNYKNIFDFNDNNGGFPSGSLTLSGNKLYGMTTGGGAHLFGVIFSIDTNGNEYTDLLDFDGTNGENPFGSLTLFENKLYGMTEVGGANNYGCIFSIDTNGNGYKDLWNFDDTGINGVNPYGDLTLLGNKLFGMTEMGGANNFGCIFSIDTNGNGYKDLWDFDDTGTNGASPYGDLTLFGNKLFGMTDSGGINNVGCIFSIDTNGNSFKDIFDFHGTNGAEPYGSLVLSGKILSGMTFYGGVNDSGEIFAIDTDGSRFKVMYDFNNINGYYSSGSLIFSVDAFYGMTVEGGANIYGGVIFKIDTNAVAGINNLPASLASINVYPNPSNGIFTVAIGSHPELVAGAQAIVEIYNVMGQRIYNATVKQVQGDNAIDLSSQPSGVYLYRVIAEDGSLIGQGKVIIQK